MLTEKLCVPISSQRNEDYKTPLWDCLDKVESKLPF